MISDCVKVSDARVQSLALNFTFVNQLDKLIITAFCSKQNMQYLGMIPSHPLIDFDDIKEVLEEGQFKTLTKTEELLKIKFGATTIELISKSKIEAKEMKDSINRLFQKQKQLELIIKSQSNQIQELKVMISDLRATVEELKSSPKVSIEKLVEMKGQFTEKFDELEKNLKIERDQIGQICNQVKSIKQEGELSKGMLNKRLDRIQVLGSKFTEFEINLRQQLIELNNTAYNLTSTSNKLMSSMRNDIDDNRDKIDKQNKTLQNLIETNQNLHLLIQQLKVQIQNQKKEEQEDSSSQQSEQDNANSLPQQTTWSQILKADQIAIHGNLAINKSLLNQGVFCLLDVGFQKTLQQKQSWAIQINNKTNGIGLGICLKSQMQNYDFTAKDIKWNQTGHGLYSINSKGYCYSHSQQEFNYVHQGFQYSDGDVIFMEYDPIDMTMRFNLNKEQTFEMPIIAPPQDDEYHPYVSFRRWNESVELILPSQFPK